MPFCSLFRSVLFRYCLVLGSLLLAGCLPSSPVITKQNIAPNYQPTADFALSADHLVTTDSLVIWVRYGSKNILANRLPDDLSLEINVFTGYDSKTPSYTLTETVTESKIDWQGQRAVTRLGIPKSALVTDGLISITFADDIAAQSNSIDIPLHEANLSKKYILLQPNMALPLFRHFVNTQESFRIVTSFGDTGVTVTHYQTDFPPALPPMSQAQKKVAPTIPVLGTKHINTSKPVKLITPGLYSIEPAQGSQGILLVMEDEYPELTKAQELIDPLIYITTSAERENLTKAPNPKRAVDKFWLGIGGSEQFARNLIREYYSRVTDANQLFTSHKPGWMSDRGMIFIVMGRPSKVNRYKDHEEWLYVVTDNRPTTQFTFLRKNHNLTQNHYELVRAPVFEPVWYSAAEQWRKGIIDP